jgi:hypothetical protein
MCNQKKTIAEVEVTRSMAPSAPSLPAETGGRTLAGRDLIVNERKIL